MCGRYASPDALGLEREFHLRPVDATLFPQPRFNTAPTVQVPVLRELDGERRIDSMRWGLVPFFAKGIAGKFSMHNARSETVRTSPAFRSPWRRGQRCIIPARGFFEWHLDPVEGKHPFFIHDVDAPLFAFGGIWETSPKEDGTLLASCPIVTLPANELMKDVHNTGDNPGRMPVILPREKQQAWLTGSSDEAWELVQPYPSGQIVAYRVSDAVNSAKNQGPDLLKPVAA